MLGKLIKYEFLATSRLIFPAYIGAVLFALLSRFGLAAPFEMGFLQGASIFFFVISVSAVIILTAVLIIRRFSSSMFKDQGYLTHTLPVSVDALIWSKLLAAICWTFVAAVVTVVSIWLMASGVWGTYVYPYFVSDSITPSDGFVALFSFLTIVVAFPSGILAFYSAISIGQMARRFKVLLAVLAYFGMNFMFGWIMNIITLSLWLLPDVVTAGLAFVIALIQGAAYYFITRSILRYRLNLE